MEINEAFVAQIIGALRLLLEKVNIPYDEILVKTNVNGRAIAMGHLLDHPIGCSGNRIVTALIYSLQKRKSRFGIAYLCIGGGMGLAILVEI